MSITLEDTQALNRIDRALSDARELLAQNAVVMADRKLASAQADMAATWSAIYFSKNSFAVPHQAEMVKALRERVSFVVAEGEDANREPETR